MIETRSKRTRSRPTMPNPASIRERPKARADRRRSRLSQRNIIIVLEHHGKKDQTERRPIENESRIQGEELVKKATIF